MNQFDKILKVSDTKVVLYITNMRPITITGKDALKKAMDIAERFVWTTHLKAS